VSFVPITAIGAALSWREGVRPQDMLAGTPSPDGAAAATRVEPG
jgi:hypothetical protein